MNEKELKTEISKVNSEIEEKVHKKQELVQELQQKCNHKKVARSTQFHYVPFKLSSQKVCLNCGLIEEAFIWPGHLIQENRADKGLRKVISFKKTVLNNKPKRIVQYSKIATLSKKILNNTNYFYK